ncbi:MAG TPA: hypothetical protein VFA28_05670 [Bryobacteraceae bacterium]|jgi:hypothetical protein|nr:hypothetical protein [Bryobacteraceae bacterium]
MKALLFLLAAAGLAASAADVSGTWKGAAETPNGTVERTFVFKQDGNKLTGETSSEMLGKSTIEDGKVDGDNISFTITAKFQDQEVKLRYSGKVTGNEMKLHVESDAGFNIDYTAKRVS